MNLELLKVLHPRAYEPWAKRDLRSVFWRITQNKAGEAAVSDVLGEVLFNSFLGGKLQATRELRQKYVGLRGEDLVVIDELQGKYVLDFEKILADFRVGEEKIHQCYRRLNVLGQVAVWQLYNLGKVSRYREYDLVQRRQVAQIFGEGHLEVLTQPDCCDICAAKRGIPYSLWSPPGLPFHPNCRCEVVYVPHITAAVKGGLVVAVG